MKTLRKEWKCITAVLVAFTLAGCASLFRETGMEICYEHPKYGRVCVKVGGKVYVDKQLTEVERAEVLEWVDRQDGDVPSQ